MSLYSRIGTWLRLLYRGPRRWLRKSRLPPIAFDGAQVVCNPPRNEEVGQSEFYLVRSLEGRPKWALFLCPCGCLSVITLSLQSVHEPHWKLKINRSGRVELFPSIWRDIGCCSHFWIRDGRVYWCSDSGLSPRQIRVTF